MKIVAKNVGHIDAGLLNMCTDYKVAEEMLTADALKAIKCALDGRSSISKIIEIEKKINVQFECMCVKTKQDMKEIGDSHGKKLVLECDDKAKEERLKCEGEHKNDNVRVRGNVCLKHRDTHFEIKIIEAIKKIDNTKKLEERFQDKHGEKWLIIGIEAREGFSNSTTSKIKCVANINMHGERTKINRQEE